MPGQQHHLISLLLLTAAPAVMGGSGRKGEGGFTDLAAKKKEKERKAELQLRTFTCTHGRPLAQPQSSSRAPDPPSPGVLSG